MPTTPAPNCGPRPLEWNPQPEPEKRCPYVQDSERARKHYVAGFQISKKSPKGDDLPGAQFMTTGNDMQKLNVLGYSFTNEARARRNTTIRNDSYTTVASTEDAVAEYAAQGGTNVQTGEKIVGMTGDGENDTAKGILRLTA